MITGHEGVAAVAVPDPYRKCIPRFMCDPLFFRERHLGYRAIATHLSWRLSRFVAPVVEMPVCGFLYLSKR